jgi:hypothetical protein
MKDKSFLCALFLNLYGASGVAKTKVDLRFKLLECDIDVADNAEEKAAKKAEVVQIWKDANTVVVKNHRGIGLFHSDYVLEFGGFNTFVGDVKLRDGKFYYEAEVKKMDGRMQLGFVTEGFPTSEQDNDIDLGVGNDDYSWGFDGVHQRLWPNEHGEFGSKWEIGDTLGFACDLVNKSISFSVNGSFKAPNGMAFEKINAEWLSPGLSGDDGSLAVNFGDRPFKCSLPDDSYKSVHGALSSPDCKINAPGKLN